MVARKTTPMRATEVLALDPLIHSQIRLAIVSALAGGGVLSFGDLKRIVCTSDGNLSVHARKLECAGYVDCRKSFHDRMPRTEYQITAAGRSALVTYVEQMERILARAKEA